MLKHTTFPFIRNHNIKTAKGQVRHDKQLSVTLNWFQGLNATKTCKPTPDTNIRVQYQQGFQTFLPVQSQLCKLYIFPARQNF